MNDNENKEPIESYKELIQYLVKNKRNVIVNADIPREDIVKILHHFGISTESYF